MYSVEEILSITYDSQGGSAVTDGDATTTVGNSIARLPTAPTRTGYTFNGWFTAASGGAQVTANAAHNQTTDFILYARWSANITTTTTTTVPVEETPPAAEPAEPVSDTPTFTG